MVEEQKKGSFSDLGGKLFSEEEYKSFYKTLDMYEYLSILEKDARPARTAFQRTYDMIEAAGKEKYRELKQDIVRYNFFSDPTTWGGNPREALFGLETNIMALISHFKNAAYKLGAEKRVLLLHGPVGSSKSTIVRLMKRGLEQDSIKNPVYAFKWVGMDKVEVKGSKLIDHICQMHEDPIKLVDKTMRLEVLARINAANKNNPSVKYKVEIEGDLCPHCKFNYETLMKYYSGDWDKVMDHVKIRRFLLSEAERVGIGSFQPKDEKNQDSTELTGNIDYRKIAFFGSDSDPRAFNLDGELCIANRGIMEFIEMLKLETAFLFDMLSASQEHLIKPKKFALTSIDEVIIGHTNEEEFRKLQEDELMKAFKDRTVRIDIPYNTKLKNEVNIYARDYNKSTVDKHIAPHTLEVASVWAVLSRLEDPRDQSMNLLQKLKLYNGQVIPQFTEDVVKKMKQEAIREGLDGISPRYIQDAIAYSIVAYDDKQCVNPFMVLKRLEENLKTSTLLASDELKTKYKELLKAAEEVFREKVIDEVQIAITSDEGELAELCNTYIQNIKAYRNKEKVENPLTGRPESPNEKLMRGIESKIGVSDAQKDEFRGELLEFIGSLATDGKKFDYKSSEELYKALSKKMFEDKKDRINLQNVFNGMVDEKEQEKIDVIISRLKKDFGYCDSCARDVLTYVASIFTRGNPGEDPQKDNFFK